MTAGTEAALGVVRAVMEVAGSPEKVFRALTDPKELEQWWGSDDVYRTFGWVSDLRPGGERSCQARTPGREELSTVKGEYVVIDPPKVLEFTWLASWEPGSVAEQRADRAGSGAGRHPGDRGPQRARRGEEAGGRVRGRVEPGAFVAGGASAVGDLGGVLGKRAGRAPGSRRAFSLPRRRSVDDVLTAR